MTPSPLPTTLLLLAVPAASCPAQQADLVQAHARCVRFLAGRRDPRTGLWDGRFGDGRADLALSATVGLALAHDPRRREAAAASTAEIAARLTAEIQALAASGWVPGGRTHLCYQLPLVLLFLARQASAVEADPVRAAARAVGKRLAALQHEDGGWSYGHPDPYTLVSTTLGAVTALAAARRAGIEVSADALARGQAYLERCVNADGGVRYAERCEHPVLAADPARYSRSGVGTTLATLSALLACDGPSQVTQRLAAFARPRLAATLQATDAPEYWFWLLWAAEGVEQWPTDLAIAWRAAVARVLPAVQRGDGGFAWSGKAWVHVLAKDQVVDDFAAAVAARLLAPEAAKPRGAAAQDAAAARALAWLCAHQRADGSFPVESLGEPLWTTALVGRALVESLARHRDARVERALAGCVRFVVSRIPSAGPLLGSVPAAESWTRHETWLAAGAALFLADATARAGASVPDATLARLAARLGDLQRATGGWSHDLSPKDRMTSLGKASYSIDLLAASNWALAALLALRERGTPVSERTLERALQWYASMANADGGFRYGKEHLWPRAAESERGRTAGALWALSGSALRTAPLFAKAAAYVAHDVAGIPFSPGHSDLPFLINFLVGALGCRAADARLWAEWNATFVPFVLDRQRPDGSIHLSTGAWEGATDSTAVGLLVLLLAAN